MKVMRSVLIDAPVDRVWHAIRRFDGVAAWNPGVERACLESGRPTEVGAIRSLDIVDGSVFRETLLAHSDLEFFYTYDIIESPLPCRNYLSTHRLYRVTEGDLTLGVWEGRFDCDSADESRLESVVGDGIYRDAQKALGRYLEERSS